MIGRVADLLATSLNPAFLKADAVPVQINGSGEWSLDGSTGYPSTIEAPFDRANSAAASSIRTDTPCRRYAFSTKRHDTDHTGWSSTGFNTRDRPRAG